MKTIFENELIEVLDTNRDYDFIASLVNKTDKEVEIVFFDEEVENFTIKPNDWVGLLADEEGYLTIEKIKVERFDVIINN